MPSDDDAFEYAGFWVRVWASLIDTVLLLLLTIPLLGYLYGWDYSPAPELSSFQPTEFLVTYVLPAIAVVLFWHYRSATPGKMAVGAQVVDAHTGRPLGFAQALGRYLGYFVSALPCCLGFIWVAFDRRKQGWHDKLARTVVIRQKRHDTEPVRFE